MMNSKACVSVLLVAFSIGAAVMIVLTRKGFLSEDRTSPHSEYKSGKKSDIVNQKRSTRVVDRGETKGKKNGNILSAIEDIRTKGSYEQLKESLRTMSRTERLEFLSGDFCGVESGFGFRLDIPEKMAVIDEFGEGRADYFKKKVLTAMVFEIDAVNDIDFIRSMGLDLWKRALASAATQNASKAFELSLADVGTDRQRLGVSEVLRVWLGSDSVAASERVSRMPQGILRDTAICELVGWLRNKNCNEDAERWASSISDPSIKNKALTIKARNH